MIDVYRIVNELETVVCGISEKGTTYKSGIMAVEEIQCSIVVDSKLDIQSGDYVKYNDVNYTLNRDDEFTQKSDVEWSYTLIFEHPLYTLFDKLITNPLTGTTTFQLTGKLIDFVDIVVWNTNKTVANPLGIDTGWTRGSVIDTDYKNISFSSVSCRDVLALLSTEFNVEFLLNNKQINYVERIENSTGLTFVQGKGNGLYEVTKQNVDKADTITRIYPVGGNKNVPNANADEQGYLKLPELYLENTTEIKRIVEKRVVFEDIFPHFLGVITSVSGTNNAEIICNDIDFNLTDIAVGSEARVNFLTGDFMGCSFEFQWNNVLKKLTLIEQKDETALADTAGNKPTIPSALKNAKVGDKFNFTGVIMPASYVNIAIEKLRLKATDWLSFYSRKRIKFEVQIDNRWMRGKTDLKAGDLVTIKIPQKDIESLLRIASLEKNLYTGKITATVSNYLDEKWEKKVEGALSSLQTTVQTGLAGVGNVDILQNYDARPASDNNVMSSLRSRSEFISAKEADTAAERITFEKGAVVRDLATPDFVQDKFAGAGAAIFDDANGNSVLEVDKITVRKEAYFNEVIINQIRFQGGIMVYSAANLEVLSVTDGGSYLQLNFDTKNGQIANLFVVDDQIRCQRFSGGSVIKYYMSRVTSVGSDYIRISKTDIDGTLNVAVGDQIVQFGNRTNTARQSLIEVNVLDGGKQTFYQNVNSYDVTNKNFIDIGRVFDTSGQFVTPPDFVDMIRVYGNAYIGDRNGSAYVKYDKEANELNIRAKVEFLSNGKVKSVEDELSSLDYLREAMTQNTSSADGGLFSTTLLMMRSSATGNPVVGGMSGLQTSNILFWSGGTYEDAKNGNAKTIFYKDGSGQLAGGDVKWDSAGNLILKYAFEATEGHVGDFTIFENAIINDSIEFSDANLEPLNSLINPVDEVINRVSSWNATGIHFATACTQVLTLTKAGLIDFSVFANIDGARDNMIHYPPVSSGFTMHSGDFKLTVWISDKNNNTIFSKSILCRDDGCANISVSPIIPVGEYIIHAMAENFKFENTNIEIIGNYDNATTGAQMFGGDPDIIGLYRPNNNTKIGKDGFYSELDKLRYFYFRSSDGLKVKGARRFFNDSYHGLVYTDNVEPIISNINSYNSFILDKYTNDGVDRTIHLPEPTELEVGVTNFWLRVLISNTGGSGIIITTKANAVIYEQDGNPRDHVNMSMGDLIEFQAVLYGTEMRYFITNFNGADIH